MERSAEAKRLGHHAAVLGRRAVRPNLRIGAPRGHLRTRNAFAAPTVAAPRPANGQPNDVLLQGFHWTSRQSSNPGWYEIVAQNAGAIRDAGFTGIWLPPPSQSAYDGEGYMPTRWHVFNSAYGSEKQLRAAISALHPLKAIADVVVNHRCGAATDGDDFDAPAFPDQAAAVCRDDEWGHGTGDDDTGEGQPAARDLDHTNADVQKAIKTYLAKMRELGFAGWRYDEVRGYGPGFVGAYDAASNPWLSVGEYWDSDAQAVVDWVDGTGGSSMAFDFPTRTFLAHAINTREFGSLKTIAGKPPGVIGLWPAMAITFVDDHDTADDHPDPQPFGQFDQVLQAYAYILTHPGIPCVFWTHFFDWGPDMKGKISALVQARRSSGVGRDSVPNIVAADDGALYAAIVDDKLAVKLGPAPWDPGDGWTVAVDGQDMAAWTR